MAGTSLAQARKPRQTVGLTQSPSSLRSYAWQAFLLLDKAQRLKTDSDRFLLGPGLGCKNHASQRTLNQGEGYETKPDERSLIRTPNQANFCCY